jgi:manganese-dependent ADP-ribose/CDP-alcohol diphosphatase
MPLPGHTAAILLEQNKIHLKKPVGRIVSNLIGLDSKFTAARAVTCSEITQRMKGRSLRRLLPPCMVAGTIAWSATGAEQMQPHGKKQFGFGLIADIQYHDADDGFNFAKTVRRHYRGSLAMIPRACDYWNDRSIDFILQCGDIIDGQCAKASSSESSLKAVLNELEACNCKQFYHLIGNHELYNFDRQQLNERLHTAPGPRNTEFYSVKPAPGWRLLVLDAYQESIIGWKEGSEKWHRAFEKLSAHNKNISPETIGSGNWFNGIEGADKRFVPFNGGLGKEQLAWLRAELEDASKQQERVLLASHVILHPKACDGTTMVWDYEDALSIISQHDHVVAVICGHDHKGGYHRDGM